ncbi:MAG: hypothetical protein A2W26_10775 [Acidobacteria bacterium RBG_16_64_8]|nr:MAG: hypothetical protein A2W26_10775 [Acidobacteria bacterium RBG_16_64_8]
MIVRPEDVMDLNAVDPICNGCGSYFHRFLDKCPNCGWNRGSAYAPVVPSEVGRVDGLPRTKPALDTWLKAHAVDSATSRKALSEVATVDDRTDLGKGVIAAVAHWVLDDDAMGQYIAAVGRYMTDRQGQINLRTMVEKIGYRYLGGYPDAPQPADVRLSYARQMLVLRTDRNAELLGIKPDRLMFASPMIEERHRSSWLGFSFGSVVYFPELDPIVGGAASITWITEAGAPATIQLANREGWFARGGQPGFYFGLVNVIGTWANMGAVARQAEIGLPRYAKELGFATS